MKRTVSLLFISTVLAVSAVAITLPGGIEADVSAVKKDGDAVISANLINPVKIKTEHYGTRIIYRTVEFYPDGKIKSFYLKGTDGLSLDCTGFGSVVATTVKPVELYESGYVKSVHLRKSTSLRCGIGAKGKGQIEKVEADFQHDEVTFHDNEVVESFYPVESINIAVTAGDGVVWLPVKQNKLLTFYESGNVKSFYPDAIIPVETPYGVIKVNPAATVTLSEDGHAVEFATAGLTEVKIRDQQIFIQGGTIVSFYPEGYVPYSKGTYIPSGSIKKFVADPSQESLTIDGALYTASSPERSMVFTFNSDGTVLSMKEAVFR